MKRLYIAAPFFNTEQLAVVHFVENAITDVLGRGGYYSPRNDGVLKDMTPEQRKEAGPKLFALNCKMIRECDAVLALKDYSDTGTTWETGFAYGIGKPVFAYRTKEQPLNIMVLQCMQAVAYGQAELRVLLGRYAKNEDISHFATGIDLRDTY